MKRQQRTQPAVALVKAIMQGTAIGLVVMLVLCIAAAFILNQGILPIESACYLSAVVCAIGTGIGCFTAQRKSVCGKLPTSLGCAAGILAFMGIGRLILNTEQEGSWRNLLIVAAAAALTALFGAGKG